MCRRELRKPTYKFDIFFFNTIVESIFNLYYFFTLSTDNRIFHLMFHFFINFFIYSISNLSNNVNNQT